MTSPTIGLVVEPERTGPLVLQPLASGDERVQVWEQQGWEETDHFVWFLAYLNLPRADRSVTAAYRKYRGNDTVSAGTAWYDMAKANRWKERAAAFDRDEDRQVQERLRSRRVRVALETADLGEAIRKKAAAALKAIVPVSQKVGEIDGREVWLMETELSPEQIAKFVEVGVKVEQLALGGPTERTQLTGDPDAPVAITVGAAKDILKQRLAAIRERRAEASAVSEGVVPDTSRVEPENGLALPPVSGA